MRAFFVFAALALAALAASVDLKFEAGANLTNADADFSFRYSSTVTLNLISLIKLLGWSSVSIDASGANSSAKAAADIIIGGGLLPTILNPPIGVLAYGNGEAAISVDLKSFLTNLVENSNLDANFAGGVVAMAALSMYECDPDNKKVGDAVTFISNNPLDVCDPKDINGDEGNLVGYTCTYSPLKTSAEITATFVTSKKAGVLEYGETPVSPRSLEMIMEVKKFPLSDKKNHVRMDIGLLTASGAGSVEGSANVVHRKGKEDLYVAASQHAIVDGKSVKVEVDVKSGSTDLDSKVTGILKVALGGNIDAQIAHVDFPAGATDFVYDPAAGAGKDVYEAGASTIALSVLVALVCALLYLF